MGLIRRWLTACRVLWRALDLAIAIRLILLTQRICRAGGHRIIVHRPDGRIQCTTCHQRLDNLPRRDPNDILSEMYRD